MQDTIKTHIDEYCLKMGWEVSDAHTEECLLNSNHIYSELISKHRWWNIYLYVVDIDGMIIGFEYADTTGDNSPSDVGYGFDPKRVWEMHPVEKIIIVYERNYGAPRS